MHTNVTTTENQCAYCNTFIVGYKAGTFANALLCCLIVAVCYNQVLVRLLLICQEAIYGKPWVYDWIYE